MLNNKDRAIQILKSTYGENAEFRDGQLSAIVSVLEKKKTLVVQRTGWGKSIVYFIATKILRERGSGPSIIISPLLSLMKNQIDTAKKIGLNIVTINSDNKNDWDRIYEDLNRYDALIISPERLSNGVFMSNFYNISNIKLFVVDEAHSISDWGHDFRPDYQRIVKLLDNLPVDISILGTTATANNRVINDIKNQLGEDLEIVRGNLIRDNLSIQVNPKQTREERLAWILDNLQDNEKLNKGQGIIYCLTQRDCDNVAEFLNQNDLSVASYHSGLEPNASQRNLELFDQGEIRILVATVKLGMGYDKSDIRFVIHYQLPSNLIAYYQQIGRAGRDGQLAYAILLHGAEDEEILTYFMEETCSKPDLLSEIISYATDGIKYYDLYSRINAKASKVKVGLNYLLVHDYIYKDKSYYRTNLTNHFDKEKERIKQENLNITRKSELKKLKEYLTTSSCSMKFIADELNAPDFAESCGICANCVGHKVMKTDFSLNAYKSASKYMTNRHGKILPRKQWSTGARIPNNEVMQEGWVLSNDYYSEIGQLVKKEKYDDCVFSTKLVNHSVNFLKRRKAVDTINLIVSVPSIRRPNLVTNFSVALANDLNIQYINAVKKNAEGKEQKTLLSSGFQQENIQNTISINKTYIQGKRILLVDDMVDSRWTFTVIASELLKAGATVVYPFALVKTGGN